MKECGRNANTFIIALAVFVALLVVAGILSATDVGAYVARAWPVIVFLAVAWCILAIRRGRARRRARLSLSPLAPLDRQRAREKLTRNREPNAASP
jgi:hypothetical protein